MLELSSSLVRRALFVESKNGESSVFSVVYDNKDGTQEKLLVKVQRNDKLPDGRFKFFEAGEITECLLDGEKVFFEELLNVRAGAVFNLRKDGSYVAKGDWGKGVATLVRGDARIFTSYVLVLDGLYSHIPSLVDEEFAELSKSEREEKVRQVQEIISRNAYAEALSNETLNRVEDQIAFDDRMIEAFPLWVPEYDSEAGIS